jgi:hypothetical protein
MRPFGFVSVMLLMLATAASAAPATWPLDLTASSVSPGRAADDLFDVGDLARRVLGQRWKALDPREQDEFGRLFRDVATRSVARVRARMTREHASPMPIEYRLARSDGQWIVYDIVVNGVSLVANYRRQLNTILGTSSVAELLERMRAEASWRPAPGETVEGGTVAEQETARERLVAGLLLSAAARSRWAR